MNGHCVMRASVNSFKSRLGSKALDAISRESVPNQSSLLAACTDGCQGCCLIQVLCFFNPAMQIKEGGFPSEQGMLTVKTVGGLILLFSFGVFVTLFGRLPAFRFVLLSKISRF